MHKLKPPYALKSGEKIKFRRQNRNLWKWVEIFRDLPRVVFTYVKLSIKFVYTFFTRRAIFMHLLVFILVFSWLFSGWPVIWQNPRIPPGAQLVQASNNDVEKIKIKFDASSLPSTYKMQGASFQKNIKADNAEKTDIKIGNETASSFEPSFEFKKWDEVRFKLTPEMETVAEGDKSFDIAGDKIKYKTPKEEIDFYEQTDSPSLPGGGYEIERILNEKPTTNLLSFDIETENLDFFYQPIYTDAEIADKANNGDFVNPDAMGSYAIYYKNVPLNYVSGKKYGTGKVGQIYRPRIDDSAGNWTYGDLNIDVVSKKLTVTIPQTFLDNAVYPIYHASGLVFGYQTAGTAGTQSIENSADCYRFTMGTNAGMVDTMTVYSNPSATSRTMNSGIYLFSSLTAVVTNGMSPTLTPSATGAAWRTTTYTSKPSLSGATDYLLCSNGSNGTGTHVVSYDTGTTNYGYVKANTFGTYPDMSSSPTLSTKKFSIYATYTAVPDAPTNVAATDGTYTDKVTITWTKSATATGYHVWRDTTDLGLLGDVATYDDTGAAAPTITPGSAVADDGANTAQVGLSVSGTSANNGTTYTYKVTACNAAGCGVDSNTNTGYRGVGSLTYQWQRSAADSDASYSDISGATASTYNDTAAPAPTVTAGTASATDGSATNKVTLSISGASANVGAGRYYKVVLNATGASQQTSASDRGYRGVGSLTYQWYRSSGDADSGYSTLSGATTAPYDDTTAPAPTITAGTAAASDGTFTNYVALSISGQSANSGAGRYFYATVSATGASSVDTSHDRGYIGVGSLIYQWQRSAADSDASYSDISGATASTYNDTGAPADGSGRYYKVIENATGATQQISTADRGYRMLPTAIEIRAQNYTTSVSTITFPQGAPESTVSQPYNNIDGSGSPQTFGGAGTAKPVVTLYNGGGSTLTIWYNVTTFTNGIVSDEYYLVNNQGAACANSSCITNAATFNADTESAGSTTINSGASKDLYLKTVLSAVAGQSGNSTLTILGETP